MLALGIFSKKVNEITEIIAMFARFMNPKKI